MLARSTKGVARSHVIEEFITGDRVQHVNAQSVQISGFTGWSVIKIYHPRQRQRNDLHRFRRLHPLRRYTRHQIPTPFEIRQTPRLLDLKEIKLMPIVDGIRRGRSWFLLQQSSGGRVDEPLPEFLCKP